MKNKIKQTIMTMSFVIISTTTLYASDDINYCVTAKASGKINEWSGITAQQELWYDNDRLVKENQLLQFSFKASEWLTLAPGFRFEDEKKKGEFQHENRPTLDLVLKHALCGWKLEDRIRFELRDKEGGPSDYMRYRNRIKVKTPWKLTECEINPYCSWELFFEDNPGLSGSDRLNRHRFQVGASAKVTKDLSLGLSYMMQTSKSNGEWKPLHVPGLEVSYSF